MRIIRSYGGIEQMPPTATFADTQKAVGGYVEVVPNTRMLVNEEGRLRGLPTNVMASLISGQVLVGDVVEFESQEEMNHILGTETA